MVCALAIVANTERAKDSVRHGGSSLASLLTPSLLGLHRAPPEMTELLSFYPTLTLFV
jgi:hypothetical protein